MVSSLFMIDSGLDKSKQKMFRDIIKYVSLLTIFYFFIAYSGDYVVSGEDFILFATGIVIAVLVYHLIVLELFHFH